MRLEEATMKRRKEEVESKLKAIQLVKPLRT